MTQSLHSAEYFGKTREHWWNPDFLRLMAVRWHFEAVRELLDVGSGLGHWARSLSPLLPEGARITGVDREPVWVDKANENAASFGPIGRYRSVVGDMHALPFADASFDCVTCQTALIHSPDPARAVAEMARVTKPGGLVVVVEPNNVSNMLVTAAALEAPVEDAVALVRFQMTCERGKAALGQGNNSIGELVPRLFAAQGLQDLQVFSNDKANALVPPYDSEEQRAFVEETRDLHRREHALWSREETLGYFVAGGGVSQEFERLWALAVARKAAEAAALASGTYACAGGAVTYLVSGRKD